MGSHYIKITFKLLFQCQYQYWTGLYQQDTTGEPSVNIDLGWAFRKADGTYTEIPKELIPWWNLDNRWGGSVLGACCNGDYAGLVASVFGYYDEQVTGGCNMMWICEYGMRYIHVVDLSVLLPSDRIALC